MRSNRFGAGAAKWILVPVVLVALAQVASAQELRLSVESRRIHADLPFVLSVSAEGFDESPEPTLSEVEIPGAKVTYLGVSPSVSQRIAIVNGHRSVSRDVTFVYRYRVEAPEPGEYEIRPITARQGQTSATTEPQSFRAEPLAASRDMRIALSVPERKVWVGEAFEVTVDWLLRRDPGDQSFVIPLFDHEAFSVEAPEGAAGRTLAFSAGAREVELPYEQDRVTVDGADYSRFRFKAVVRPQKAGRFELEPPRVVARLQSGFGRDAFGFRSARFELYKAEGEPVVVEVAPLPVSGRPPSFAGAVGDNFSLEVQASRTVVSVGEPIELSLRLRSTSPLEGVALPPLHDAGLPESFSVPDEVAAGELGDSGTEKLFRVTVRLTSPEVREVPPLAFSYFDPAAGEYRTVASEPIALSVDGSAVVGAGDVVGGADKRKADPVTARGGAVGAELALSAPGDTLRRARRPGDLAPWLALLYALPLLVLAGRLWQLRSSDRRDASGALREAARELDRALAEAEHGAARDTAPRLVAALKGLARAAAAPTPDELIARIETEAYDPRAAELPLAEVTREQIAAARRELASSGRRRAGTAAATLVLAISLAAPASAPAQSETGARAAAPTAAPVETAPSTSTAAPAEAAPTAAPAETAPSTPTAAPAETAPSTSTAAPAEAAPTAAPAEAAPSTGTAAIAQAAPAAPAAGSDLERARALYAQALAEPEREARTRTFARAESAFRRAVAAHPDRPELLADWGNAALGAGDHGRAVLAYRRALALDPGLERARRNLGWVRSSAPEWLPRQEAAGAADAFFFWHERWSPARRHLVAALAFAAALLLMVPWPTRRRRLLRGLALAPAAVCLAMWSSLALAEDDSRDVVLVAGEEPLRTADSAGAPPVYAAPLPAGTEAVLEETRSSWARITLADGTDGWVRADALALIAPAD